MRESEEERSRKIVLTLWNQLAILAFCYFQTVRVLSSR